MDLQKLLNPQSIAVVGASEKPGFGLSTCSNLLRSSKRDHIYFIHPKRDAVLAFRQEIQKEFEKLLAADTGKALDQQALVTLIKAAVQGEDVSAYAVEVGQVTDGLRQELARELQNGL